MRQSPAVVLLGPRQVGKTTIAQAIAARHPAERQRPHRARVRGIEPDDLLGREPVALDEAGVAEMISSGTVLVTGAGGSLRSRSPLACR